MTMINRLADRMLSAFVPNATAAASAAACVYVEHCQRCGSSWKWCLSQYCDGVYRSGFCDVCGTC